jgi:cytochrome c biogenesis protein CcmG/thiol:disulfide interchange protein DsbE
MSHILQHPIGSIDPRTGQGRSANLFGVKRIGIVLGAPALVVALAIGLSQAGSGSGGSQGGGKSAGGACGRVPAQLAGAPAPLARLHSQGCRLLGGGASAFKARLAELRGHPIVVNAWASWCHPCRGEFPIFQEASIALGRRVAFVGLDSQDNSADAAAFLKRFPVSYPSYIDGDNKVAQVFGGVFGLPTTVFYDAAGRRQYVHAGPYTTVAKLRADIARYGGA